MTAGPVNRALFESFFQNPGDIYDDAKTEGAMDVLADQIDDNWTPLSNILGANGSTFVGSPAIVGVIGTLVYDQLVSLKAQIDAIVGASIPPGSVTYDKLAPLPTSTPTASVLPLYNASSRLQTADPVSGTDVVNKQHLNTYVDSQKPLAGFYTGNGVGTRTISLPFTPSGVLVLRVDTGSMSYNTGGLAVTGSPAGTSPVITVVTNGFQVVGGVNTSAFIYNYVAFQ